MSLLKYVTIVNQNGESSKSTKRKTTDHQQEKIKDEKKYMGKWILIWASVFKNLIFTLVSNHHTITEILLKVALNTINHLIVQSGMSYCNSLYIRIHTSINHV